MTANIYRIKMQRPPTFINAGNVVISVEKMIWSDFKFLKSLNILPILKALNTYVAELNSEILNPYFNTMKIKEPKTMTKSKTFQ